MLAERVRLLYARGLVAQAAVIVNAAIVARVFWGVAGGTRSGAWLLATCALAALRLVSLYVYKAGALKLSSLAWARLFTLGAGLNGVAWGAAAALFFVPGAPEHQLLIAFVLAGMTAGSAVSTPWYTPAFVAFTLPAVAPLALRSWKPGDAVHVAMALMVLVFAIGMVMVSRSGGRAVVDAIRLRFKNESLLEEQRTAELGLAEAKDTIRGLVDSSPDPMLIYRGGRVVRANRALARYLGYDDPAQLLGTDPTRLVHERDRDAVAEWIRSVVSTGEPIRPSALRLLHRDGTEVVAEFASCRIVFDGEPAVAAIGRDVTERRRAEGAMERARQQAEAANRAKSTFLANMSHEIRTPLNAILGYAQLASRDGSLGPTARRSVEVINRSGEHLLELVNHVLEMSRIEAGRVTVDATAFDLHRLLDDLDAMFVLRARDKALAFQVQRGDEVPRLVVGDEGKVRQVLVNLLGNALKFTSTGEVRLSVSVVRDDAGGGERLAADVSDTGPGIAQDEQERLFQDFEQAESGRKVGGGTGLGLAISRSYARLMGGEVTLASELGAGSTFRLELPLVRGEAEEVPARPARARVLTLRGGRAAPRVLLVDDQESNRAWLGEMLRGIGFDVEEACDGREAVARWRAWTPEVVLMDVHMAGQDGFEATRTIRAEPGGRATLIVGVSATAVEEDRAGMVACGADAFLVKPVRGAELLEVLRARLGLEYVYADPPAAGQPRAPARLTRDALARVPPEELQAIRDAVRRGDMDRLDEILRRVEPVAPAAARGLRALAERFEYAAIGALVGSEAASLDPREAGASRVGDPGPGAEAGAVGPARGRQGHP